MVIDLLFRYLCIRIQYFMYVLLYLVQWEDNKWIIRWDKNYFVEKVFVEKS